MSQTALPLALLPGLLCDRTVWVDQCARFEPERECFVPDYGVLDSLTGMAELVLEHGPAGRFALAGHSMGGRVAFEIMRLAPERVAGLALLDTGYQPLAAGEAGETERAGRYALLRTARAEGMRKMGLAWARGMVHPDCIDTPLFGTILDMIERRTPEIFTAQIQALLGRPDATPVLRAIACPALVLCGRDDSWSPLARHEEMARAIRGAELVAVDRCGHMATMEQAGAVNEAFAAWLKRIDQI